MITIVITGHKDSENKVMDNNKIKEDKCKEKRVTDSKRNNNQRSLNFLPNKKQQMLSVKMNKPRALTPKLKL